MVGLGLNFYFYLFAGFNYCLSLILFFLIEKFGLFCFLQEKSFLPVLFVFCLFISVFVDLTVSFFMSLFFLFHSSMWEIETALL